MSGVCERCYMVVAQPCQTPTEWADCPKLRRSQELQLPKVIQHDGPLTRLSKANQRKGSK